jgi:hypothetical protein
MTTLTLDVDGPLVYTTGLLLWGAGALYAGDPSWLYPMVLPLGGGSTKACCVYSRAWVDCLLSWLIRSEISLAMFGSTPGIKDGGTGGTEYPFGGSSEWPRYVKAIESS